MIAVTAERLMIGYGRAIAVAGVSLQLEVGQVAGLTGASGSGKSTLARALAGVAGPEALVLEGKVTQRVRIGFVPQEPVLWLSPYLKVGGQVLDHVNRNGTRHAIDLVKETFLRLGLSDPLRIFNSYPHELSGGQLQRIAWAQALVGAPEFIIADEPTTALDSILQREILQLAIAEARSNRAGLLWVSHDLNLLEALGGRLLVMERGSIVEDGPVDQVLAAPRHPASMRHVEAWQ